MRIAILTVTDAGFELAEKISARMEVQIFGKGKNFDILKDFVAEIFDKFDALIFICATGIAVRMIAPHIVSKLSDPAVIVLDERGRNVISLLSGHVGGANELTLKIAAAINSNPVITTATDVENKFAADTFAAKLGLVPTPKSAIQAINSAVLREEEIYLTAGNVQLKLTATDTENKFAANLETLKTSINAADLREEPIYITAGNVQLKLTATDTENKFAANLETLKTSINAADLREEPIYLTAGNVQLKLTAADTENKFAANLETLKTSINAADLREEEIYLTAGNVQLKLTATDTENKFAANLETLKTSINEAVLREEEIYLTAGNVQLKLTATDTENKFAANLETLKTSINAADLREEPIYITAGNVQLKLTATDTENKFAANLETLKTSINGADLREEEIYLTAGNVQLKLTATDTENKFAANLETLKTSINAADLREEPIYITAGNVQLKLTATDTENKFAANLETLKTSINEAVLREEPIYLTAGNVQLNLIPQKLIAGIGCKRGTSAEKIFDAVQSACEMINQPLARIKLLASVDIKRDEKGLLEFAENLGVDIKFFPVEELAKKIAAYRLSESAFVKAALGVGNVCEAAALCCVERARFALNKKSFDGVTVALILEKI